MHDEQPTGTGRALVLFGSVVSLAVACLVSFLALVFWPVLTRKPGITGTMVLGVVGFVVLTLAAIIGANLLAVRRRGTTATAAVGCATLVIGFAVAFGVLALSLSANV